jgi:hypothetical protein
LAARSTVLAEGVFTPLQYQEIQLPVIKKKQVRRRPDW